MTQELVRGSKAHLVSLRLCLQRTRSQVEQSKSQLELCQALLETVKHKTRPDRIPGSKPGSPSR